MKSLEWLDSNDAKGEQFRKVISQLDFINKYLGNEYHVQQIFKQLVLKSGIKKQSVIRVLDLGCGSGYVLSKIGDTISNLGYSPFLIGIDNNQEAVRLATETLSHYDHKLICAEVNSSLEIPQVDFLFSSHFLYHLSPNEVHDFLSLNAKKVKHSILFSELHKSKVSESMFPFFTQLMGLEKEVRQDGLIALKNAPTHLEFQNNYSKFNQLVVEKKWCNRTLIHGKL